MYRSLRSSHPLRRPVAGFTLIELMITVAIIAILAAIALPAYTNQIRKSRRGDAKIALLDMAARQERFNTVNFRYANTFVELNYQVPNGTTTISVPGTGTAYYTLTMSVPTATTFTLTATAANDQRSDGCGNFTLTDLGVQGRSGTGATLVECWR